MGISRLEWLFAIVVGVILFLFTEWVNNGARAVRKARAKKFLDLCDSKLEEDSKRKESEREGVHTFRHYMFRNDVAWADVTLSATSLVVVIEYTEQATASDIAELKHFSRLLKKARPCLSILRSRPVVDESRTAAPSREPAPCK